MRTEICKELGIEFPIFAFSHCRDVVAAVSKAGGFGVLGALTFSPEELEQELAWIDEHVDGKPYGVDIVIPASYVGRDQGDIPKEQLEKMVPQHIKDFLNNLLEKHKVPPLPEDVKLYDSMLGWTQTTGQAHLDVSLNHPIKLVVNALGPPPVEAIEKCHAAGVKVGALVGSVDQALKQKKQGVDVIIASGTEAGGHTGEIATMVLTPQVVDAVAPTPVLTAGGIGSGRQMAAAMMLGAQGVWTGSIWLTVNEADGPEVLINKLLAATSHDTIRSRCLTGKPARQLKTTYTMAWEAPDAPDPLPMPLQFLAVAEANNRIYKHSMTTHETAGDLAGIAVGQVVGMMNQRKPTREVIYEMVNEYIETVEARAAELAAAIE
ncbi:MAG: nitronate monooxygenase [Candidatus Dadabacteria bacterium]|nr:MAG: nitronate monooxygenase [Candidatus Dadabacteria bacterium]